MTSKEVIAIQRLEIAQLKTKVENLEKVIEILKKKFNIVDVSTIYDEYVIETDLFYVTLTQEEYELLKGVFKNGKYKN